ncbi:MAG: hypothetical protein R3F20_09455 [Planctomycetota bacterium]
MSRKSPSGRRGGRREAALAELEALCARASEIARDLFLQKPYSRDVTSPLPDCELPLRVDFRGRPEGRAEQARELLARLESHVDDAILGLAAFRPGSVYSFFDERADLPHCRPRDPREIFCGYGETGLPLWKPMLAWGVETGFPRIEDLAAERARPVLAVFNRGELLEKRLESFSRKDRAYDLRGQIAVGYYTWPDGGRFAVTLQLVRSSTRSRAVRLGLNVLGLLPDGRPADALLGTDAPWSYVEIHRQAQRRLAAINQAIRALAPAQRAAAAATEADRLLADLVQGGGRIDRRAGWRTGHATDRAREGKRPTGMARRDVDGARPERIFRDADEKTVVVLGPRGRVHVFSDEGLHVTSLHLDRRALDRRIEKRRWQAVEPSAVAGVLAVIRERFERAS